MKRTAISFEGDDDESLTGQEDKRKSRSTKKKEKERKRRLDFSKAYEELEEVLSTLVPEPSESDDNDRKKRKKIEKPKDTRLDLIGRATSTMKRLYKENKALKREGVVNDEVSLDSQNLLSNASH